MIPRGQRSRAVPIPVVTLPRAASDPVRPVRREEFERTETSGKLRTVMDLR